MLDVIKNFEGLFGLMIFVLLFVVLWNSLKRSSIFPDNICLVLSLCAAAICVISLRAFFSTGLESSSKIIAQQPQKAVISESQNQQREFIMLPWITLAISIIVSLVFIALMKVWSAIKSFFNLSDRSFDKDSPKWHKTTNTISGQKIDRKHDYSVQGTLSDDPERTER